MGSSSEAEATEDRCVAGESQNGGLEAVRERPGLPGRAQGTRSARAVGCLAGRATDIPQGMKTAQGRDMCYSQCWN